MLLEFPTEAEWRSLSLAYDYKKLEISEDLFPYSANPEGSIERFTANQEIFFGCASCFHLSYGLYYKNNKEDEPR